MTVILDGQAMKNTAQDLVTSQTPQSFRVEPGRAANETPTSASDVDIDALIAGRSVMAVEIYPSSANAPAELIPLTGKGSCGLVAIWTGPRQ